MKYFYRNSMWNNIHSLTTCKPEKVNHLFIKSFEIVLYICNSDWIFTMAAVTSFIQIILFDSPFNLPSVFLTWENISQNRKVIRKWVKTPGFQEDYSLIDAKDTHRHKRSWIWKSIKALAEIIELLLTKKKQPLMLLSKHLL